MFARKKTGWVGIDVGATSVKAVQLVRADGGYAIRSAAVVPRADRWKPDLLDGEPRSSADEISCAASICEDLVGSIAATAMPVGVCEMLQVEVPAERTSRSSRAAAAPDLRQAIESETQQSIRNRVYDHWPVLSQPGKLNVVTAPRAWSDQLSGDLAASGWQCRNIDALPWALARAAALVGGSMNDRPVAALDWAYGKSTICFVKDGVPTLVRSLKDCAFQSVLDVVAGGLRMSERDAEALLQGHGLDTPHGADGGVIEGLLQQPINHLLREIRRTIDYWRGVTRGQSPEALVLFGGGATLPGIENRLASHLGIPVAPWALPRANAPDAELRAPHCLLGVAAGLSALAWEAS